MAWAELETAARELTIKDTGVVEWNTSLQITMGDPKWIQLMWDSSERWLGVRGVNSPHGFIVNVDEEAGEFKIDSADALSGAGISIAQTQSGEPEKWVDLDTGIPTDPLFGYPYQPIYYLSIPE
jgi:hypothetical protein